MSSQFFSDSIFWVEIEKIHPNPFQPRKEFEESKLRDLAESIRQYGILQPLVVTRKETIREDGGLTTEYELISGERRLRASKLSGLAQVPVLIRNSEESDQLKLELAIIENLQREDLNAVDRAKAFQRLVEEFHFKHSVIALKIGKSREYVSNSLRILSLPEHMLNALAEGKISEGHTRPLLMLIDRPEEQEVLFKEIMYRRLTVRDAELSARKIAVERARKIERMPDPEITELEEKLASSFGTRVQIERNKTGGKIMIDFFSNDDLRSILDLVSKKDVTGVQNLMERHITNTQAEAQSARENSAPVVAMADDALPVVTDLDDRSTEEKAEQEKEDGLYSVENFTV